MGRRCGYFAHPWLVQTEGEGFVVEGFVTSDAPLSFDDFFIDRHERLNRALYFVTAAVRARRNSCRAPS